MLMTTTCVVIQELTRTRRFLYHSDPPSRYLTDLNILVRKKAGAKRQKKSTRGVPNSTVSTAGVQFISLYADFG